MKTKLILLVILFHCTITTFAQIQSETGKLILTGGREVSGKISHFYDTPLEIILNDADNNKKVFQTNEVSEIILSDSRRFTVKNLNSEKLVFQVIIASDKINLYKRESSYKEFYLDKDNEVYILLNNEIKITENGKTFKKKDYQYISVLTSLMQDRTDLISKIQKVKIQEKDLVAIVTTYTDGNISYQFVSDPKTKNDPYWAVYAQYSNYKAKNVTTDHSFGYQAGFQYYFASTKRSSIRIGLDYATYHYKVAEITTTLLSFKYQYDIVRKEKMILYLNSTLLVFGNGNVTDKEDGDTRSKFDIGFPISPSMGFEYKGSEKLSLFAELNYIFRVEDLPNNYSLGIKYSLRK